MDVGDGSLEVGERLLLLLDLLFEVKADAGVFLVGNSRRAAFVAGYFAVVAAEEDLVEEAIADDFWVGVATCDRIVQLLDDQQKPFLGILLSFALHVLMNVS
jgi:hypothetical protein